MVLIAASVKKSFRVQIFVARRPRGQRSFFVKQTRARKAAFSDPDCRCKFCPDDLQIAFGSGTTGPETSPPPPGVTPSLLTFTPSI